MNVVDVVRRSRIVTSTEQLSIVAKRHAAVGNHTNYPQPELWGQYDGKKYAVVNNTGGCVGFFEKDVNGLTGIAWTPHLHIAKLIAWQIILASNFPKSTDSADDPIRVIELTSEYAAKHGFTIAENAGFPTFKQGDVDIVVDSQVMIDARKEFCNG